MKNYIWHEKFNSHTGVSIFFWLIFIEKSWKIVVRLAFHRKIMKNHREAGRRLAGGWPERKNSGKKCLRRWWTGWAGWAVRILYYYSLRTSFRACLARSQTCPQARGHQEERGKERGEEERKKEEAKKEERGERESRTVRNELIFDRFRAPRSIGASIWIESASKNRCCAAKEKVEASQQKIVRSPKIAMRRFYTADIEQSRSNFRSFLSSSIDRIIDMDRIGVENRCCSAKVKICSRHTTTVEIKSMNMLMKIHVIVWGKTLKWRFLRFGIDLIW